MKIIITFLLLLALCFNGGSGKKRDDIPVHYKIIDECGEYNIENMKLVIYYMHPDALGRYPLSVERIKELNKIEVLPEELAEYAQLIDELFNYDFIITVEPPYIDCRLYYVFETLDGEKICDIVAVGSLYGHVINGHSVKESLIVYEMVMPFLEADGVGSWFSFSRYMK
ncbi:MAG: hypothetical protein IJM18_04470 [Clostridia bacterium]|nr:hypothetical protein [Clostridia bacterium]